MQRPSGVLVAALGIFVTGCSLDGLSDGVRDAAAPESGGPGPVGSVDTGAACPGCAVLVNGEDNPTEIIQVGSRLVWLRRAATGFVVESDLDGGGVRVEQARPIASGHDLVSAEDAPFALDGDGTMRRYFSYSTCTDATDIDRLTGFGPTSMLMARKGGLARGDCGANQTIAAVQALAVTASPPLAWYSQPSGEIVQCDASSTMSACSASRSLIAGGQGNVNLMAHDDLRIYWVASGELRSRRRDQAGSTAPPDVIAPVRSPKAIVPAGDHVFWTEVEDGTLSRAPRSGGAVSVIARELAQPWGLLLTANHIYLTESGAGRIVRLPRPR